MIYKKANEGTGARFNCVVHRPPCRRVAGRVIVSCSHCPPFLNAGATFQQGCLQDLNNCRLCPVLNYLLSGWCRFIASLVTHGETIGRYMLTGA